jgi:putative membrane protein insertion efficiency factor
MKYIGIYLVKFYQKFISPLKPPCCRFRPTCSSYAIEAFKEWGFIVGLALTAWRILRCNPFSKGGYDPVPKRKRKSN